MPEQMCSGISIYLMTFFLKNKKTVEKWKRWLYNTEITDELMSKNTIIYL